MREPNKQKQLNQTPPSAARRRWSCWHGLRSARSPVSGRKRAWKLDPGPLKLEQLCCLPHVAKSRPISGDGNGILADGVVGC